MQYINLKTLYIDFYNIWYEVARLQNFIQSRNLNFHLVALRPGGRSDAVAWAQRPLGRQSNSACGIGYTAVQDCDPLADRHRLKGNCPP